MDLWNSGNLLHSFKNLRSVQIDTINYCNRKCAWCPNSKMEKNPGDIMEWKTLEIILDQLSILKFDGRIHPYLNGEPLCDYRMLDILKLIRKKFPKNPIWMSSNGDYLGSKFTPDQLFDSGLTCLQISDWDGDLKFLNYYYDKRIDVVPKQKVTGWYNRGGNIDVECVRPLPMCKWVFEKMYINFKGDIIVCCSDFYNKFSYGNLLEKSMMEIWISDLYKEYRIKHFFCKGKELPLCENCNRIVEVPNA